MKDAFDAARSGGTSPLLDKIFNGINIVGPGSCVVNPSVVCAAIGVPMTGAEAMRRNTTLRPNLANGNYMAVANALSIMNYNSSPSWGNSGLPATSGVLGTILTRNGFPENYIKTNPQFLTANLQSNMGHANYHGMQAQFTYRAMHGLSMQGTYTWSRNLGIGAITDPRNFAADYTLLGTHREHMLVTYGTWDLPFGPSRLLLKNSSGVVGRIAGGWQVSWISNLSTGAPFSVLAGNMLYGAGVPDKVGPFDTKSGHVSWANGAYYGNYFNNAYTRVADPQCSTIAPFLKSPNLCTLGAIKNNATGQIVLQNPLPGTRGNFGQMNMTGPASWNVDLALVKAIKITESKNFQFRVDVSNAFNHPQPSGPLGASGTAIVFANPPIVNINDTVNNFGQFSTKAGRRVWQAKLRFEF